MQMYGRFEGFPLNSALFRLVIHHNPCWEEAEKDFRFRGGKMKIARKNMTRVGWAPLIQESENPKCQEHSAHLHHLFSAIFLGVHN